MQMNADQIRDYAPFAKHVRTVLPTMIGQTKIMDALKNNSGASDDIIKNGLLWGTGPVVNVKMLIPHEENGKAVYPTGGYTLGTNIIDVGTADVGRFQTNQDMRTTKTRGQMHLITIILLHELTHWAREKSKTTESEEDGFAFEMEAFGEVIKR